MTQEEGGREGVTQILRESEQLVQRPWDKILLGVFENQYVK